MQNRRGAADASPLSELANLIREMFQMDLAITRTAIARFAPGAERFFSAPALLVIRLLGPEAEQ